MDRFFLLPKAVLKSSSRGGTKSGGKQKGDRETQERARRWLGGQREELWEPGKTRERQGAAEESRDHPEERRARALELAAEGLLSKACTALLAEPPVEVTKEVISEMEENIRRLGLPKLSAEKVCGPLMVVRG